MAFGMGSLAGLDTRAVCAQALRQREVLYRVDFRLVLLQRQLARAGGQRTDDEAAALHARIAQLAATLDGRCAERSLLTAQIKKTEQDLGERPTCSCRPSQTLWVWAMLILRLSNANIEVHAHMTLSITKNVA